MINVQIEFIAKTTVRVIAYVYDDDGALVDPVTSIKVTITDPNGDVQVDEEAMTQQDSVTGVYEYYHKTEAAATKGQWTGEVEVIDGSGAGAKTSMGTFEFRIK